MGGGKTAGKGQVPQESLEGKLLKKILVKKLEEIRKVLLKEFRQFMIV